MTRTTKFIFTIAAMVGLVLGGIRGFYKAKEASAFTQSAALMSTSWVTSDFASQQYEHADSAHARQAVLLEIKILEQLAEQANRDSTFQSSLGFAYTRLAMIDEAAGQTEAERSALAQARVWFKLANPHKELTDEQLMNALKTMDAASDSL